MENATQQILAAFKALADPARLRLLALCANAECSVSELTTVLGASQPRVSQHLKALCAAGLLERFRDGHFVYYRVPVRGSEAALRRRLLDLLPEDEPVFHADLDRLRAIRGILSIERTPAADRLLHRALVELTVATPLGDLLDIGCGQGRILKLLATRAQRAVGVDIDADARRFARAELLLAGIPHCTLRKGDMYTLPFPDRSFDTVILDDVLGDAERPVDAIHEAARTLRPGGRLWLLAAIGSDASAALSTRFARWSGEAGLRLSAPRTITGSRDRWLLAVGTPVEADSEAA